MKALGSVMNSIGNNPVVKLSKVLPEGCADIYVLLEYFNPGGSVKDRIARYMIEEAERRGDLRPGYTIVEATSGNTGIAFALVGAIKGYRVAIVMPESMSVERKMTLRALGAELICTPGCGSDIQRALDKVEDMRRSDPKVWVPDQFSSQDNADAHRKTTGPEIVAGVGRDIGAFVAGVGTGGTLVGIGAYLQDQGIDAEIVAVEPAESAVMQGKPSGRHRIEGIGDGFIPPLMDMKMVTRVEAVSSDEAISMTRRLMREEGIMGGISTGANVVAAINVARDLGAGKKVVTLAPDTAMRYFSTDLFRD